MRTLGNIIWSVTGGLILAVLNFLMGLFLVVLVVTAPLGMGLIHYSKFCLFPFTTEMVSKSRMGVKQNSIWRAYSFLWKLIYLPFGIFNVISTIPVIILSCLFIITIPQAIVMAKSLGTILSPAGKICVSRETGKELRNRKAELEADRLMKK